MSHNITIEGGSSVRLLTKGKYCDRDIIVTSEGGSEDLNEVLTEQEAKIAELKEILRGKAVGEDKEVVLQSKTVTPTKSIQEIVADDEYDGLEKVTVEAIPNEYIIPSGTRAIAENGTHDVEAYKSVDINVPIPDGYIQPNGAIDITENGTHDITEYATVNVNVSSSGGDNGEEIASFLDNTMTVLDNSLATTLRARACQGSTRLVTVNLPSVTTIGTYAFYDCSSLNTLRLPSLQTVSSQPFYNCNKLTFADCGNLKNIPVQAFNTCTSLITLILRKSDGICTLSNINGLTNSGIDKGTGYVYVPKALVETYKANTNWATFVDQFRAIEDYPEICGG
jgi:hypothetical protein